MEKSCGQDDFFLFERKVHFWDSLILKNNMSKRNFTDTSESNGHADSQKISGPTYFLMIADDIAQ